jgi:hypothetical protein
MHICYNNAKSFPLVKLVLRIAIAGEFLWSEGLRALRCYTRDRSIPRRTLLRACLPFRNFRMLFPCSCNTRCLYFGPIILDELVPRSPSTHLIELCVDVLEMVVPLVRDGCSGSNELNPLNVSAMVASNANETYSGLIVV